MQELFWVSKPSIQVNSFSSPSEFKDYGMQFKLMYEHLFLSTYLQKIEFLARNYSSCKYNSSEIRRHF